MPLCGAQGAHRVGEDESSLLDLLDIIFHMDNIPLQRAKVNKDSRFRNARLCFCMGYLSILSVIRAKGGINYYTNCFILLVK